MRVLLDKAVGNLTDPVIEPVSRIEIAAIAFAKVVMKRGSQRQLCATKAIDRLPVVPHGEQSGVLVLCPQRRQQRRTLRGDILKLIHQYVFPGADKTTFFQNNDRLMNQAGKINGVFCFQGSFPRLKQRCHQLHPL